MQTFKEHLNQLKKFVSLEGPACSLHTIPEVEKNFLVQQGATEVTDLPGFGSEMNLSLGDVEDVKYTKEVVQKRQQLTHEYNLRRGLASKLQQDAMRRPLALHAYFRGDSERGKRS